MPKPIRTKKHVTLYLNEVDWEALQDYAREHDISASMIIRRLTHNFLCNERQGEKAVAA